MISQVNNINNAITVYVSREKLQLEIAARERAERKQQEYEDRLRSLQEEMERSQVHNSSYLYLTIGIAFGEICKKIFWHF